MTAEVVVISGVSGCGKTTIGEELAKQLNWGFKDGDDLHSEQNRTKMKNGRPLTDEDRTPWLENIVKYAEEHNRCVIACSALKKQYRDLFRRKLKCKFFLLDVSRQLLEQRLSARKGHFMPTSLLDSQLATLERPYDEPDVSVIQITDAKLTVKEIADEVKSLLSL